MREYYSVAVVIYDQNLKVELHAKYDGDGGDNASDLVLGVDVAMIEQVTVNDQDSKTM